MVHVHKVSCLVKIFGKYVAIMYVYVHIQIAFFRLLWYLLHWNFFNFWASECLRNLFDTWMHVVNSIVNMAIIFFFFMFWIKIVLVYICLLDSVVFFFLKSYSHIVLIFYANRPFYLFLTCRKQKMRKLSFPLI